MTAAVLDRPKVLEHPNAAFWLKELDSGVTWREAEAAKLIADEFSASDTDVTVTVYDNMWREIGQAGGFIEVSGTIPRNAAPQATLKLPENHWLDPYLSECEHTMVGVRIQTDGIDEAFYVKHHREKLGEDGKVVLTSELVGIWDILNHLPVWPSWTLPIQAQPFSHAVYFSPLCTCIEAMAAEQSFRIQSGLNEFLNNALSLNPDVRAWIGSVLQAIENDPTTGSVLQTPLYVVRTGLFADTSPLFCRTVRMETVGQVITDITKAYGVDVRVYLWLPGMPQPDKWANLTHPTYVMVTKDRSQIEGPTKTVLDSALRTVVDVQGSLLGRALDPLLNPEGKYAPEGLHIAPALGLDFDVPYAVLVTPDTIVADGEVIREKSPLVTYEIVRTTPAGWQHIVGGKSPKWVCAPRFDRRGAQAQGQKLNQRPAERLVFVRHRRGPDHPRIHWRTKQSSRRVPQRRLLRVPADTALRPPRRGRPVSSGDRGFHPDELQPLQHRDPVPDHPNPLGYKGLHDSGRDIPGPQRAVQAGPRYLPRRADEPGLCIAHEDLHRPPRAGVVQAQPHRP